MLNDFDTDELGRRIPQIDDPDVQAQLRALSAAQSAAAQAAQAAANQVIPGPFIAQRDGKCWIRSLNSHDYSRKCSVSDLRLVLQEMLKGTGHESALRDEKGKLRTTDGLLLDFAVHVRAFERSYISRETRFDPTTGTLHEGFQIPAGAAQCDEGVAEFLRAFAGSDGDEDALEQWIMSCRPDALDTPAAALILVGPPGVGKTLLATVLAEMWGSTPVAFKSAMRETRFQSELLDCPILLIDESFPKGLTQSEFSDIVQSRDRRVERKGVDEKTLLRGCYRIIACVNDLDRVRFVGSGGVDAVNALADRLSVFEIASEERAKAALENLKVAPGSPHVDLERFKRHFRWIQQDKPRPQRFLGVRKNNRERSAAIVLRGEIDQHPELFDFVRSYCENTAEVEAKYRGNVSLDFGGKGRPNPGALAAFPLIIRNGELCAYPKALALGLGLELKEVRVALKPFQLANDNGRTEVQIGGQRAKYMRLNGERLLSVIAPHVDIDEVLFDQDTADRLLSVPSAQVPMSFPLPEPAKFG